jgi:hypothetical protein
MRNPQTWSLRARHLLALGVVLALTAIGLVSLGVGQPIASASPQDLLFALLQLAVVAVAGAYSAWFVVRLVSSWWLVPSLIIDEQKPWACPRCSSFWASAIAVSGIVLATGAWHLWIATLPAAGGCLRLLMTESGPPEGSAPPLPDNTTTDQGGP